MFAFTLISFYHGSVNKLIICLPNSIRRCVQYCSEFMAPSCPISDVCPNSQHDLYCDRHQFMAHGSMFVSLPHFPPVGLARDVHLLPL